MNFDDDKILATAHLFEQARGRLLQESEVEEIRCAGLQNAQLNDLTTELVDFIRSGEDIPSEIRSSAYWALGKRGDPSLLLFFQESLATEVRLDVRAAYQVMIALESLGESVFDPSRKGCSYDEDALNTRDAMVYLNNGK